MAISRPVNTAAADGTTITIPVGHQAGDLILIWAFAASAATPALGAGFTSLAATNAGASGFRLGGKVATSSAETSGTWTSAAGLVVAVYRGVDTSRLTTFQTKQNTGTSATPNYGTITPLTTAGTSWIVAFSAIKTTTSALETVPTNLFLRANTVGAANEYASFDSNGAYTAGQGSWPATTTSVTTSAEWRTMVIEIIPLPYTFDTYTFAQGNGMSQTEIVR